MKQVESHPDREDFSYYMKIPTRWGDNDMLGHVNNVIYYRFIEAIVVRFVMDEIGIDWLKDPVSPRAVESLCRFHRSVSFPTEIEAALRVEHIGRTSVRFEVALFEATRKSPVATGYLVEVFVDSESQQPTPINAFHKSILQSYSKNGGRRSAAPAN